MINLSSLFMTFLAATIASAKVSFWLIQLPPPPPQLHTYLEIIGGDQRPQNTIEQQMSPPSKAIIIGHEISLGQQWGNWQYHHYNCIAICSFYITTDHIYIGRWSYRLPSCAWAWSVPILWVQVTSGSRQKTSKEWKIFGSWWWSSNSLAISWWSYHPRWAMNPATGWPRLPCWPSALTPSFVTQPIRWTFSQSQLQMWALCQETNQLWALAAEKKTKQIWDLAWLKTTQGDKLGNWSNTYINFQVGFIFF